MELTRGFSRIFHSFGRSNNVNKILGHVLRVAGTGGPRRRRSSFFSIEGGLTMLERK